MNRVCRGALLMGGLLLVAAAPAKAQSQSPETRFSVERVAPPPGGFGLLTLEEPRVRGHLHGAIQLLAMSARQPLVLTLREGDMEPLVAEPVRQATTLEVSAALELYRTARFGLALPFLVLDGERLQGLGEDRDLPTMVSGDLRLHMTFAFFQSEGIPLDAAAAAVLILPTGDSENFAGLGAPGATFQLLLGSRPLSFLHFLARLGWGVCDGRVFFGTTFGNRLLYAAGFELDLPWVPWVRDHVQLVGELDGEGCFSCETEQPLEARGGLRVRLGPVQALLTAGAGLTDAATVPGYRIGAALSVHLGSTGTEADP